MADIVEELADEQAALDALVAGLSEEQWRTPTPAEGWDVLDTVSHLRFFDTKARLSLTDPAAFEAHRAEVVAHGAWFEGSDVQEGRELGGAALLAVWRTGREDLLGALRSRDLSDRVPWYGPDMSVRSFATARLMETWAHGVDVSDALGRPVVVSDRLRNVCHLGISARPYSFWQNGVTDPGEPVRLELVAPSGEVWAWGPEEVPDRVTGPALDFALLVTQRRHRDDTALVVTGSTAEAWLAVAQAFAGPSGGGRQPLGDRA